nr:unnamed protein product [Callosobruchus chinensis]
MGNRSSLLLREEEIAQIQQETGFTPNQIERLYSRFTSLDRGDCGTLSRDDFLRIPELAINPLGERIVNSFFQGDEFADRVNFRQFMHVLAHFRPIKRNKENKLNSREEKLKCKLFYNIYFLSRGFKFVPNWALCSRCNLGTVWNTLCLCHKTTVTKKHYEYFHEHIKF